MADMFTKDKRSSIMSGIRSKGNSSTEMRLIAIMEESLTRAKTYARQIEKRIAAQRGDTERRRSGRAVLIDALATKHAPSLAPSSMGSP